MASSSGTATNLEDLFGKIITFLTTNAALVAASQQWQVLRQYRDNVAGITTNLVESATYSNRRILHSFRWDPRSINTNDPSSATQGAVQCTSYVAGTSYISLTLRTAKEIKSVRLTTNGSGSVVNEMLQNFRLQYSDDNSTWTTALTVASNPTYVTYDSKTFAVPGTPGAHLYWRIIIDRKQNGATTGSIYWKGLHLLDAGGDIANHFGSEALLKATGNAGADNIYTGIRSEYDAANGWFNLFLNGYTGYDPNVTSFFEQPGAINPYGGSQPALFIPMVPCWNAAMPYWFRATGRMFSFGVKVSTSFEGGYMGFILPYASPSQFPYPLAVGGSLIPQDSDRSTTWRYSYSDSRHSVFPIPGADTTSVTTTTYNNACLYLRTPDGLWQSFAQRTGVTTITEMTQSLGSPFARSGLRAGVWPTSVRNVGAFAPRRDYRDVLGGGYILQPLILHQRLPIDAVWGELDGCFAISGFSNASENTTSFSGTNYVIFQNTTRTEVHEYWALAQD
ncbi:putative virion structural protein [Pseudomonas phage NP1]|uniref:Putative virion structural protein n=1 Tax=Pseudomonas phage NP1 TaxID=1844477 RepID=A0A172PZT2_9CAUD|nr:structural protein [Pseudomonas phage NP1]AND74871.1 putative virion structural protein [Pseudomonas phage NP1]